MLKSEWPKIGYDFGHCGVVSICNDEYWTFLPKSGDFQWHEKGTFVNDNMQTGGKGEG